VCHPVGTMLQFLFCYCIDFEEEIPCSKKMKEINECRYAGWQPVMPGLLQCEFLCSVSDCVVRNKQYVFLQRNIFHEQ